jgi:O-antigen ligase
LMPGFYDHAIKRFDEVDREMSTEEARTRETVWTYAKLMIADHPVIGIGFGEYKFVETIDSYGFRDRYGVEPLDNPHNSYLQMAVYAGLPALVVFVLANLVLLSRAGQISIRDGADRNTPTVFGLAVGIAGFLASAYPDMHLFTVDVGPTYWVLCGLLFSLAMPAPKQSASKTPAAERVVHSRAPLPTLARAHWTAATSRTPSVCKARIPQT